MRTRHRYIIILFILLAIILGVRFAIPAYLNSEGNTKSTPVPNYSQTIMESKENNVFKYEVIANKPTFSFDNSITCQITSSWVENVYYHQVLMIGAPRKYKMNDAYQLMIALKINPHLNSNDPPCFHFIGNQPLDTLIHYNCENYYSNRIDSIKVPLYSSETYQLSSRKDRKAIDTLIFIKKPNNSNNLFNINDTLPLKKKEINLRTAKNIQVLSINKKTNNDTTDKSYYQCKSWSLTAKQIISAIKQFKSMSSEERFLSYSYYPCEISGEIKIDGVKFKYLLEANATLTLINNSSYYFGFTGKNYKQYFLSGRLTDKELQQ